MEFDSKKLADFVGVTETKFGYWIEQKEPIPMREQELIASWLRTPMRDIYSDIPPTA